METVGPSHPAFLGKRTISPGVYVRETEAGTVTQRRNQGKSCRQALRHTSECSVGWV